MLLVELQGVTKTFRDVVAADAVDLNLRGGEVHCLLGENGAGKSTLMNVLAGVYVPDRGSVLLGGRPVRLTCPRDAIDLGIGMVRQHSNLVPTFTVLENLMLGAEGGIRLRTSTAERMFADLSARLGVQIDHDVEAGRLALGQQQQVEIIKALWREPKVLILDEPTSMLSPQGIRDLERVLVELKRQGLAIVFITHKLHEAIDVADRVSVMRRGRVVDTIGPERLRSATRQEIQTEIVALMFPQDAASVAQLPELSEALSPSGQAPPPTGPSLLEIDRVVVPGERGEVGIWRPLSLTVHAGEVVGVAGVDGSGQGPLAEAIAGQRPITAGDVRLSGRSLVHLDVRARQRLGLRYVTDDREGEGLVGPLPISLNLLLKRIGTAPCWRYGFVRQDHVEANARQLLSTFGIDVDIRASAETLSGGTMQKTLLARELSFNPSVVVFNKPTHGLDVKTTVAVRAHIRELVQNGAAALVVSTDLEELLQLCDRIAVLADGSLAGVVANRPGAGREVGMLMVGGSRSG